jgi:hypothetical protein
MLMEGVSDHCHERVSVKAAPGSALEVVEPDLSSAGGPVHKSIAP